MEHFWFRLSAVARIFSIRKDKKCHPANSSQQALKPRTCRFIPEKESLRRHLDYLSNEKRLPIADNTCH